MIAAVPPGLAPVAVAAVVGWALAGAYLALVERRRALGAITGAIAVTGGAAVSAWGAPAWVRGALLGLLAGELAHLVATLPDGRAGSRRRTIAAIYVLGVGGGSLSGYVGGDDPAWVLLGVVAAVVLALALRLAHRTYLRAGLDDRRTLQWTGWSILVVAETSLVLVVLRLLTGWPEAAGTVALASSLVVPGALVLARRPGAGTRIDRVVVHTMSLAGLTVLVIATYVAVVVVLDRSIRDDERALLVLSMLATVVAALVFAALRPRVSDLTNQLLYGERSSPDESLRTWASRLSRAIPLDELLLQLVESLRTSLSLASAEIYIGTDGRLDVAAGVPHRERPTLVLPAKERSVVARAGVSGGTWLEVWVPQLVDAAVTTRVAPIVHGGELLGMIVVATPLDADPIDEEGDRVLTELARQVGLALHNVQLDSALQASLEEVRRTNVELQESRRRIVSAGDAERRKLERDLHDGAQQHLVAMAVKLRLAEELVEDDPRAAVTSLEDLRAALQETIAELRALAHGIFPPLLSSGGLREALPAAAGRSPLLCTVETGGVGRFSPEVESTVYFCCLEAMQNAAKHAGDGAEVLVAVREEDDRLTFSVTDDGAGFELGSGAATGHGFVNMRDRLGAVGGSLDVGSSPGRGTRVQGTIPLHGTEVTGSVADVAVPTA